MSCNRCANEATPAMREVGVPARQTQATWAQGGDDAPQAHRTVAGGRCPQCSAFLTPRTGTMRQGRCLNPACEQVTAADVAALISLDGRREMYRQGETCPQCGGLKARESACPHCLDSGQIGADALPPESRWMAGGEAHVSAGELARAFSAPGDEGRLAALRRFPGLASRLDGADQEALWDEVRRYPGLALVGHVPDALAEAGGIEHLAWAAEQEPLAAGASLRTLVVIGQRHPRGEEILREILAALANELFVEGLDKDQPEQVCVGSCGVSIPRDEHAHQCAGCGATLCNFCAIASPLCRDCQAEDFDW